MRAFAELVAEHRDQLTGLDAAIGDGDHGTNMDRGMQAAVAALDEASPATARRCSARSGMTVISTVGGASGPLFGTLFLRIGTALGESTEISLTQLAAGLRAGLDGVAARGKAEPGDKTMLDALAPAVAALEAAARPGRARAEALRLALSAAEDGRDATIADAGSQGPRELPRRAQRRASGPGRHHRRPAARAPPSGHRCDPRARASPGRAGRRLAQPGAGPRGGANSPRRCCTTSPVPIAVAAGLDEQTLGTDALGIKAAIEEVAGPAGVVVLMDLGSAVLSAELALELLEDPQLRDRVLLSAAPLVEGLVAAAVAAAGGAGRQEVAAEAQNALAGKAAQLDRRPATPAPSPTRRPTGSRRAGRAGPTSRRRWWPSSP